MAWTTPRDWTVGEIITEAMMDTHIKNNLRYLKGTDGVVTLDSGLILPDGATFYIHIPNLTTTQRDALTPTAGMLIYNSTTTQFNKYENAAWRADLGFNSHHGDLSGLTDDDHTQYLLESLLTTQGDLPYATGASTWDRLPKGTAYQLLAMNAGATAPEWAGAVGTTVAIKVTDTLRNSNDLEKSTNSIGTYVKIKETKLNADLVACRIKFYLRTTGTTGYGRIYKNGAAIGTERSVPTATPNTFSEDFTSFVTNDLIQVYAYVSDGNATYVSNLRFYYSKYITAIQADTLSTDLLTTTDPTISMTNQDP